MVSLWKKIIFLCSVFALVFFAAPSVILADNIDPDNVGNGQASLEINDSPVYFDPGPNCLVCDVTVTDTEVNGLFYGPYIGTVSFSDGVFNDGQGNLTGVAWGDTVNWIDFSGVTIDEDGYFNGVAVTANRENVIFSCPGANSTCVQTAWTPPSGPSIVLGCLDQNAINFNPLANFNDGSCEYPVEGCTDDAALNYNDDATVNDDSCEYPVEGCIDPLANNYNANATQDDGSCTYDIEGCTDPLADNYNPNANISDNDSCQYTQGDVPGCTNPDANNYDASATQNDGSCTFDEDIVGCTDPLADNYNPNATESSGLCFFGTVGCTDPLAENYNPLAEVDNGSCYYGPDGPESVPGCTDSDAINFNPAANVFEEGSCIFDVPPDGENDPEGNTPGGGSGDDPSGNEGGNDGNGIFSGGIIDTTITLGGTIADTIHDWLAGGNDFLPLIVPITLFAIAWLMRAPWREFNLLLSLFGFYKTRKNWGVVYDSHTKQPLDPVYVTLFNDKQKEVATSITDMDGRYGFLVNPGLYRIEAKKADYAFPSQKLRGKRRDELYQDLYFGEYFSINSQDEVVSYNIPMDSLKENWNEKEKRRMRSMKFYRRLDIVLSVLSTALFIVGALLSVIAVVAVPNVWNIVVVCLYAISIPLYMIGFRKRPRGSVSGSDGQPLSFAVVRVFSATLDREVKHVVTGETGKYFCLVNNGRYYLKIEKRVGEGYELVHTTQPFDVTKGYINQKIDL